MQQRHMTSDTPITTTRYRLQGGFAEFRADFGDTIREARKDKFKTQEALAPAMEVSRETVSRIENGAVPRPDTLEKLLKFLELELAAIALAGSSDRPQRPFDGSGGGDSRLILGRDLRRGRLAEGLSLSELSSRCRRLAAERSSNRRELSAAQLSRIEHGEATRSRALDYHPDDADNEREERRMVFVDPELRRLAELGRHLR